MYRKWGFVCAAVEIILCILYFGRKASSYVLMFVIIELLIFDISPSIETHVDASCFLLDIPAYLFIYLVSKPI